MPKRTMKSIRQPYSMILCVLVLLLLLVTMTTSVSAKSFIEREDGGWTVFSETSLKHNTEKRKGTAKSTSSKQVVIKDEDTVQTTKVIQKKYGKFTYGKEVHVRIVDCYKKGSAYITRDTITETSPFCKVDPITVHDQYQKTSKTRLGSKSKVTRTTHKAFPLKVTTKWVSQCGHIMQIRRSTLTTRYYYYTKGSYIRTCKDEVVITEEPIQFMW